jgi:catechol 2,3-dioxygenase-like lactoylglutathione lyase family enzyme
MTHPPIDQQITFLYTRDLQKTAHFYEEVMELPLVVDQGTCRIYRITDSAYVGFCQNDTAPDPATNAEKRTVIVTLVTNAVDAWYEHLQANGVQFEKAPATNEQYKIYHAFLRDPNGYLLEIQRFLDADWNQ